MYCIFFLRMLSFFFFLSSYDNLLFQAMSFTFFPSLLDSKLSYNMLSWYIPRCSNVILSSSSSAGIHKLEAILLCATHGGGYAFLLRDLLFITISISIHVYMLLWILCTVFAIFFISSGIQEDMITFLTDFLGHSYFHFSLSHNIHLTRSNLSFIVPFSIIS